MKKELDILDKKGKKIEKVDVPAALYDFSFSDTLVSIYVRASQHNKRQGTSSAKNRAEVSGSGAKPWKQKGLGRARVGSKRNPLWRHGGVVHGPKPKSWNLQTTRGIRKGALLAALADKINQSSLFVLNDLNFEKPKSKEVVEVLKNIGVSNTVLIVTEKPQSTLIKGASNLTNVKVAHLGELSAYDVLKYQSLVVSSEVFDSLKKEYGNKIK